MKTTTTLFRKYHRFVVFVSLIALVSISCKEDGKGINNPIPSENPVYLAAEAQTKNVRVKNLFTIGLENSETDKQSSDGKERIVENSWVKITTINFEALHIEVKENLTKESRTYNLPMYGKPGESTLTIIQAGKISEQ